MATTREILIEEIISNARRDRKRLEAAADGLANGMKQGDPEDPESGSYDPDVAAAFAEELSRLGDSLTRVNQQLVELVKADRKKSAEEPTKLGKAEVEEVYDEIHPEEVN